MSDGHGDPDDDGVLQEEPQQQQPVATPVKKARLCPLSDQLLGCSWPRPAQEDDKGQFILFYLVQYCSYISFFIGVLSILDAATNNLALLINTLDLQVTPSTPNMTPLQASPLPAEEVADYDGSPKKGAFVTDSPLKKTLQSSMSSISSLHPYAQSHSTVKPPMSTIITQQIAPWPTLVQKLSLLKESPSTSKSSVSNATPPSFESTFRWTHKTWRTLTPAPEPDPEPIYQPLHPAKVRVASGTLKTSTSSLLAEKCGVSGDNNMQAPSSLMFGSRSSSSQGGSKGPMDEFSGGSLTPVFKHTHDQERKRSSLVP